MHVGGLCRAFRLYQVFFISRLTVFSKHVMKTYIFSNFLVIKIFFLKHLYINYIKLAKYIPKTKSIEILVTQTEIKITKIKYFQAVT